MAIIDIHRPHTGGVAATRAAVEHIAEAMSSHYGVSHQWVGNELRFNRSGVKGHITIASKDVHVRVDLGLMMGAMKPLIEREIERQLDKHLA